MADPRATKHKPIIVYKPEHVDYYVITSVFPPGQALPILEDLVKRMKEGARG